MLSLHLIMVLGQVQLRARIRTKKKRGGPRRSAFKIKDEATTAGTMAENKTQLLASANP